MGVITISLNDETEKELRNLAKAHYAMKKGAMAKIITEAIKEWKEEQEQEKIKKEALARLEKGYNMGKFTATREELHER